MQSILNTCKAFHLYSQHISCCLQGNTLLQVTIRLFNSCKQQATYLLIHLIIYNIWYFMHENVYICINSYYIAHSATKALYFLLQLANPLLPMRNKVTCVTKLQCNQYSTYHIDNNLYVMQRVCNVNNNMCHYYFLYHHIYFLWVIQYFFRRKHLLPMRNKVTCNQHNIIFRSCIFDSNSFAYCGNIAISELNIQLFLYPVLLCILANAK